MRKIAENLNCLLYYYVLISRGVELQMYAQFNHDYTTVAICLMMAVFLADCAIQDIFNGYTQTDTSST